MKLYTTHCPICLGVEKIIQIKKLNVEIIEGEEAIKALGYTHAPLLEVDGVIYVGKDIYKKLAEVR